MRFLTADYLYPLHIPPIKKGILQISKEGEIIRIHKNTKSVPVDKLEKFKGVLCPGFVNTHCHLELSHLKDIIPKKKGMLEFIKKIQLRYDFDSGKIQNAIIKAEQQMKNNGIVAVGDICNTSDTLFQKQKEELIYYNFIESFEIKNHQIEKEIDKVVLLHKQFVKSGLKATIVPHAMYSVPPKLMKKISEFSSKEDSILCIHNQETAMENSLFEQKRGELYNWLKKSNADPEIWIKRKRSTDIFNELQGKKLILVHNTFAKKEDIKEYYYCTCPKANLYIEKKLPDYSIFNPYKLCVGTDSLASNNSLSILEELLIIQEHSTFNLDTLLKIASKNGAEALGIQTIGTFENGKKPGVNLLTKTTNFLKKDVSLVVLA